MKVFFLIKTHILQYFNQEKKANLTKNIYYGFIIPVLKGD